MGTKNWSKKRAELLSELEYIIGSKCYNGNIQNYGPGGVLEDEGRSFRYPLKVKDGEGNFKNIKGKASDVSPENLRGSYYAFGANQLDIINGLDDVLSFLERKFSFKA